MFKPRALRKGDTIGIIAPSSPTDVERVFKAKKNIKAWGYNVKLGKSCLERKGYLAGNDQDRAEDIMNMFQDSNIDAIICLRGGYGALRILNKLDYSIIKKNPKIFVGYSDITAMHITLNQVCKMVTFHGPMAASNMSYNVDQFTLNSFFRAVTSNDPIGEIHNPLAEKIGCLVPGEATGEIVGGNLTLVIGTLGTQYEIDTKGKILLLEEVDEEPYRIDRMLTHLALAGKFNDARGVILGDFKGCIAKDYEKSFTLMEVFQNVISPYNKPTIYNLKTGHCIENITIPLGVKAKLMSHEGRLSILERAAI